MGAVPCQRGPLIWGKTWVEKRAQLLLLFCQSSSTVNIFWQKYSAMSDFVLNSPIMCLWVCFNMSYACLVEGIRVVLAAAVPNPRNPRPPTSCSS
jgi:hypothetical protein